MQEFRAGGIEGVETLMQDSFELLKVHCGDASTRFPADLEHGYKPPEPGVADLSPSLPLLSIPIQLRRPFPRMLVGVAQLGKEPRVPEPEVVDVSLASIQVLQDPGVDVSHIIALDEIREFLGEGIELFHER
jgi:hypothetical protein